MQDTSAVMARLRELREQAVTPSERGCFDRLGIDDEEPPYGWGSDDRRDEPYEDFDD